MKSAVRPEAPRTPAGRRQRRPEPPGPVDRTQTVGVRELKSSLSAFLRRVGDGESLIVTDRGRPVARLSPPDIPEGILRMMREGKLVWSGRKPNFDELPPVKLGPGPSLSDVLIEMRHED